MTERGRAQFNVLPWMLGATLATPAAVLGQRRRGPTAFVSGSALVYAVFIAFSKQSFCNYWWFVLGASAAGSRSAARHRRRALPTPTLLRVAAGTLLHRRRDPKGIQARNPWRERLRPTAR